MSSNEFYVGKHKPTLFMIVQDIIQACYGGTSI